ncbi:TrbC/VirB2 family protein [Pelomonas sp. Root1444]|uniref:TrbC/VirB2 family protein n=1 Tax=Pelomonas sp. Root1444 TaxID=1736464 RepID=UPI0007036D56|nr:TrbC/VirB2 family protein [Pelomonas sp. Root1444]KQY88250.1 conjugal transfer protein TrbC [Pelomonas sp. Root1444]
MKRSDQFNRLATAAAAQAMAIMPPSALAEGFEKVNSNVDAVVVLLVSIAIAVVTIAIMWAGFKIIFQGARLADVANILIGSTLIGGASAIAALIAGS